MSIAMTAGRFGAETIAAPDRLYRISVEQYDTMARAGVLSREDRVELVEGLLVRKMTKNERNLTTAWLIQEALRAAVPDGWFVVGEWPIVLPRSEPEPDVMVVRGGVRDYLSRKPGANEVALVVEVADTSYDDDRARLAVYGGSNVPRYWIANLGARRIEAHTNPSGPGEMPGYGTRADYGPGSEITLDLGPDRVLRFRIDDLLMRDEDAD
jgi:Uma2 family endonuclease